MESVIPVAWASSKQICLGSGYPLLGWVSSGPPFALFSNLNNMVFNIYKCVNQIESVFLSVFEVSVYGCDAESGVK